MPEGDTIRRLADRIQARFAGQRCARCITRDPRLVGLETEAGCGEPMTRRKSGAGRAVLVDDHEPVLEALNDARPTRDEMADQPPSELDALGEHSVDRRQGGRRV